MNPNREELLFALALEKPVEKRAVFLDAMGVGDESPNPVIRTITD